MRYLYRSIILASILFATVANAADVFVDILHWRVTETQDWILSSNFNSTNQDVTYHTIKFPSNTGIRIGAGLSGNWNTRLYITHFFTKVNDSAHGQLVGIFLPAKIASSTYSAANIAFKIDYNVLDWDISKQFIISPHLRLEPLVGFKAGKIDQSISTDLTASTFTATENIKNDFTGLGPKAGISGVLLLANKDKLALNLKASFETAFLWGRWIIKDKLKHDTILLDDIDLSIGSRQLGSIEFQSSVGVNLEYKNFSATLSYEIYDWLNQNQVFDDGTGGHDNDLLLQGLTFGVVIRV